uniref:Uncharacterized protein n=1 Tax=Medicago truncatula TaxID=3880 RepID=I3SCX8_MEDTR|nr:unknown [Medicago truncatula]
MKPNDCSGVFRNHASPAMKRPWRSRTGGPRCCC